MEIVDSNEKCDRCGKKLEWKLRFHKLIRGLYRLITPPTKQIFFIDDVEYRYTEEVTKKGVVIVIKKFFNDQFITLCDECRKDFERFMKNE